MVSSFQDLPLSESVRKALIEMNFETPSPIQMQAIPLLLEGRDVIGQAQTGTGKTAAFGIPLAEMVDGEGIQALVLCPTRELVVQVAEELNRIGQYSGMRAYAVYGGAAMGPQARALLGNDVNVIVATPGRLIDHIERGNFDTSRVRMLVLDEADEMLNMGFLEEIQVILEALPVERQALFFSATMPEEINRLARRYLNNPETVKVTGSHVATDLTTQHLVEVGNHEKLDALLRILAVENPTGALVFRKQREWVDELVHQLNGRGMRSEALHGGLSQNERERVLQGLRDGKITVLVATDVAARGLDVDRITHVINYDAPTEAEAYVHRIGRTGRAGREGKAYLFVTPAERRRLREIEHTLRERIPFYDLPTNGAVHQAAQDRLKEWLTSQAATVAEDGGYYLGIVDQMMADGVDLRAIAAAAVRRAAKAEGHEPPQLAERAPRQQRRDPRDRGQDSGPMGGGAKALVWLNVGHHAMVRPGDLVGAIANEANIAGREIGHISIDLNECTVEVPAEKAEHIVNAIQGIRIRNVVIEAALTDTPAKSGGGAGRGSYQSGGYRQGGGGGYGGGQRGGYKPYGKKHGGGGYQKKWN